MEDNRKLKVTLPNSVTDPKLLDNALAGGNQSQEGQGSED